MSTPNNIGVDRRGFLKTAGAASMAGLAGCLGDGGGGGDSSTITIGQLSPFSGGYGFYGEGQKRGVNLLVEMVNDSDEILPNAELEIVTGDTKTDPEVGLSAARDLVIQDQVDHLIGTTSSAVGKAVRNFVKDRDLTFTIMNATSGYLTNGENCNRKTFRDHNHTGTWYEAYGDWAVNNLGEKFYLLFQDYTFGYAYKEQLIKGAEAAGGTVVDEAAKPLGANTFGGVIDKIMNSDAEWLFMGMAGTGGVPFYTQAVQRGLDIPCFGMPSPPAMGKMTQEQFEKLPEVHTGVAWYPELDIPANNEYVEAFDEKYGERPSDPSHYGYACAKFVALMLDEAGAPDANIDEVISAGEGLAWDSVRGETTIRACDHQGVHPVHFQRLAGLEGDGPAQMEHVESVDADQYQEPCEDLACNFGG